MSAHHCLIVADAVTQTGFARVTHNLADRLHAGGWTMSILGVNYDGDPHGYPYRIYPAVPGGDTHGVGRLEGLCKMLQPDVVLMINDPWIVKHYLPEIPKGIPTVAYMPVDGMNQTIAPVLNTLTHAIAYTNFGRRELILGGLQVPCDTVPHGVDTEIFRPVDRIEARAKLKFKKTVDPASLFIVGAVGRNQPRKRFDLTIQYWAQWWVEAGQPSQAFLYLHTANMDEGWNIVQLCRYFGIETQLILTNPHMSTRNCMFEAELHMVYSMFDVQLGTSLGEGWGLTHHEGMACGVPQIVPRYAALGEWCDGAAHFVEVTSFMATPKTINTIGGVADRDQTVAAIDRFYRDPAYRSQMSALALARATMKAFSWDAVAGHFHRILTDVVVQSQAAGVEAPTHGEVSQVVP